MKNLRKQTSIYTERLKAHVNNLYEKYGFVANPFKTKRYNFNAALNSIMMPNNLPSSTNQIHNLQSHQPLNLAVHNLCHNHQPPTGTKDLLGLGLKYCIVQPKATPNITTSICKLAYRIRTKNYLLTTNKTQGETYIPKLYIKLKNWNPPPASLTTEEHITLFEKKLREATRINNLQSYTYTSLTPTHKLTRNELKHSTEFIILPTDKNLGPAIMNRYAYIKQVLTEHLCTPSYLQLNSTIAVHQIAHTKQRLIEAFQAHRHTLTQPELDFFTRSFTNRHCIPIFYGMPKVHKTPLQLRPVVSCINSVPSIFSMWLDFRMHELLHLIPSYIKNSTELIHDWKNLTLP
jgi:hypothetical protein